MTYRRSADAIHQRIVSRLKAQPSEPAPLPPLVPLTTDAFACVIEGRGFTVAALGDDFIQGERKVGPKTYEELSLHRYVTEGDWLAAWTSRTLTGVLESHDGYACPQYSHKVLLQSKPLATVDDLMNWLQLVDFTERKFA